MLTLIPEKTAVKRETKIVQERIGHTSPRRTQNHYLVQTDRLSILRPSSSDSRTHPCSSLKIRVDGRNGGRHSCDLRMNSTRKLKRHRRQCLVIQWNANSEQSRE